MTEDYPIIQPKLDEDDAGIDDDRANAIASGILAYLQDTIKYPADAYPVFLGMILKFYELSVDKEKVDIDMFASMLQKDLVRIYNYNHQPQPRKVQ